MVRLLCLPDNLNKAMYSLTYAYFSDLAQNLIEHSGEVYGQLSAYYRVAGMTPPESRPKK